MPTRPRVADRKWVPARVKDADRPLEHWDFQSGEVRGQGHVLPSLLLDALYNGDVTCDEPFAADMLEAVAALARPDKKLWATPLVRVLAPPPPPLAHFAKRHKAATPDTNAQHAPPLSFELRLHVYATRLLLYIIAHPAVKAMLDHLEPPPGALVAAATALPAYPQTFRSHGGASAPPFSLEGLLKSCEHKGYREGVQPAGVALALNCYQLQALAWMADMESSALLPRGVNGLFWEVRKFVDGGYFYYSRALGEMRLEEPPLIHGGLLCDEMGLGKTLEVLSLVASTLPARADELVDDELIPSRATLIVVPPTLLSQWEAETAKSLKPQTLSLATYSSEALIKRDSKGKWKDDAAKLAAHDIVLTTYNALDKCNAALGAIAWHRIVLDEMQEVRSSTTELARKCERLHCGRRWMVSGTPLYDKIGDLLGELNFLRVSPFGAGHEDGFWRHVIDEPWLAKSECVLEPLHLLLGALMLRRSKSQTTLSGTPILRLPPKTVRAVAVKLNESDLAVYAFLEQMVVSEMSRLSVLSSDAAERAMATRAIVTAEATERAFDEGAETAAQAAVWALTQARAEARRNGMLVQTSLRLLREAAVSVVLLSGGAGVNDQLSPIDAIARAQLQTGRFANAAMTTLTYDDGLRHPLRRLNPSEAILFLGSTDRRVTNESHVDAMHNPRNYGDFERHANQSQRVHDRARTYRLESISKKRKDALTKLVELKKDARMHTAELAHSRWMTALERITTGALLFHTPKACEAARDNGDGDGDGDGDGGGDGGGDGADAEWVRMHHAGGEAQVDAEAADAAEAAVHQADACRGGSMRWVWLCRALRLNALKEELKSARHACRDVERSVRTAQLSEAKGRLFNQTSDNFPVFSRPPMPTKPSLAAQSSAQSSMAEQAAKLSKELRCGEFRPGSKAFIAGSVPATTHWRGSVSVLLDGDSALDVPREEGARADEANDGADETDDKEGDSVCNGVYVHVRANEEDRVPTGWVLNRQILNPKLLARECLEAGIASVDVEGVTTAVSASSLESDSALRAAAHKALMRAPRERLARARRALKDIEPMLARAAVDAAARHPLCASIATEVRDIIAMVDEKQACADAQSDAAAVGSSGKNTAVAASAATSGRAVSKSSKRAATSRKAESAVEDATTEAEARRAKDMAKLKAASDVQTLVGVALRRRAASEKEAIAEAAKLREAGKKRAERAPLSSTKQKGAAGGDAAQLVMTPKAIEAVLRVFNESMMPLTGLRARGFRPSEKAAAALSRAHADWGWTSGSAVLLRGLPPVESGVADANDADGVRAPRLAAEALYKNSLVSCLRDALAAESKSSKDAAGGSGAGGDGGDGDGGDGGGGGEVAVNGGAQACKIEVGDEGAGVKEHGGPASGTASTWSVRLSGLPPGWAIVNVGTVQNVELLMDLAKRKGVPLPLECDQLDLPARLEKARAKVRELTEVRDAQRGQRGIGSEEKEASAKALAEAKKALSKLESGRRAWAHGTARATALGGEGGSADAHAADDTAPTAAATADDGGAAETDGVPTSASGTAAHDPAGTSDVRGNEMVTTIEASGKLREMSALALSEGVFADLREMGSQALLRKEESRRSISELMPYMEKLKSAQALNLSDDTVEQSGFEQLFRLERGLAPTSVCPICYELIGKHGPVVLTQCAHTFCKGCLLTWMSAQQVLLSTAERAGSMQHLCPCCRNPFTRPELIEVAPMPDPETEAAAAATARDTGAASGAASGASSSGDVERGRLGPEYSPAYSFDEVEAMPLLRDRPARRVLTHPSVPTALLAHMHAATNVAPGSRANAGIDVRFSPKIRQLLSDLEALGCDAKGVPHKAVVFSSHKSAVHHLHFVLSLAGVPHVTICAGDKIGDQQRAVATWTTQPECKVFLLHAGAAAAGLTLVAAHAVFLMEPFTTPGQELQAMNRCHRIGQQHAVQCVTYYCERTVEERLLALRRLEGDSWHQTDQQRAEGEADMVAVPAQSSGASSLAASGLTSERLRFVFGMLDDDGSVEQS